MSGYIWSDDALMMFRNKLIETRNYFVNKPFYLRRKKLQKEVSRIDSIIDLVDFALRTVLIYQGGSRE